MNSAFVLDALNTLYSPDVIARIGQLTNVLGQAGSKAAAEAPELLADTEILFSGWGAPKMDAGFLLKAPRLKIVFYGAGSIRPMVTDEFWKRGIRVCSAWAANAVPVSEYCLGQILFALKCGHRLAMNYKSSRGEQKRLPYPVPGAFESTVGIVSAGMIGRRVMSLLRPFSVHVLVYDPWLSEEDAAALGAQKVSLEALFSQSDVVSLHTPWLPETEGLITGAHIGSMKQGATLINSSRGAVIRENEMTDILKERQDLFAVLDVTCPEPPEKESPLYTLDNVMLTPHIAGSMDHECYRHGEYMYEELCRYLNGEPLKWEISEQKFRTMA